MGNAAYDAFRAKELAERERRLNIDKDANDLMEVITKSVRGFLEGNACLIVQDAGNDERRIIFQRKSDV
jgi:hypothetical protein